MSWHLMQRCALFLAAIVASFGASSFAHGDDFASLDKEYRERIVPFLQSYCMDCHAGDGAEAGLNFEVYKTAESVSTVGRAKWNTVLDMLTTGDMPPEDYDQPEEKELHAVLDWVKRTLASIDCSTNVNPGRETIRRLNRAEYRNTIRDLMGVDYEVNERFPADDVGYGFDNIGDVLSTSPLLFEKFYEAADEIANRAIITDEADLLPRTELPLEEFRMEKGGKPKGNRLAFPSNNRASYEFEAEAGTYLIAVYAHASQAGDEPSKLGVRLGEKNADIYSIRNEAPIDQPVEMKVRLRDGKQTLHIGFLNDFYDPDAKNPKRRDRNMYVNKVEIVGPLIVTPDMYPDSHKRIFFVKPGENGLTEGEAALQILSRFTSRAFRRPATPNEMLRLGILYQLAKKDGLSFEQCIREVVVGILCSPHFVFRIEEGPEGDHYSLNEYQLATRLSYFMWSTMPDDELLALAWQGKLRENLDAQITRMLKDPRSETLVHNFAGQWLELRKLETVRPDRKMFRSYDAELAEDMRSETELFFKSIIEEDRSLLELIGADYTFLNERLAKHYGIGGVSGEQFRRVDLKSKDRGGILTQASILTVTSNPTRTSPVKRGKWILENILGTPPPEAPPNIPTLESQKKLSGSLREQMAQHRENPACASCHARMDGIGFALENFDAVGAWRNKDGQYKIDASGELTGGVKFEGAGGLKKLILEQRKEEFVRNVIAKTLTFALGRGVEYYDECAIRDIKQQLEQNDYRFSVLIRAIVRSEPFQNRSG